MTEREPERAPLADRGTFVPTEDGLATRDPLDFEGYADGVRAAAERSGVDESVVTGRATIGGHAVELAQFSFEFFGGSMGEVTGERIARAIERAASDRIPFVLHTRTGGARMQEGMRSLIQMAKITAARTELGRAAVPFIAVLGHPTTGGVLASIAALADVTVAESDATIGFAGPRVAERFTGEPLPPDSHTAVSAFGHGLVDEVVTPGDAPSFVSRVLTTVSADDPRDVDVLPETIEDDRDAWDVVTAARSEAHAKASELLPNACDSFVELRGDRGGADDPAVMSAVVRIAGRRAVVVALDRAHPIGPHGYRKARRCLAVARRLHLPFVTLIDTRGADPSARSESDGVAWEIAATFDALLASTVPIASIVTGEGGSGGALALAAGDVLLAFRDSFFSVIGPEGAAEILWRDADRAAEAARALALRAVDLKRLGVVDAVLDVDLGPRSLGLAIAGALDAVASRGDPDARRARWRNR
ncbi:MAG TPA: carboxyl transferase domain-containing protein [Actinomycetota bacterium]|nr:carboxyl transferase domain-containing protein [Actinomycetota bacterium]